MNIQELLNEQSILIPLEATSKEECMQSMIDGLAAAGCIRIRQHIWRRF